MPTTEPTVNVALAEVLMGTRSLWGAAGVVRAENTEVLRNSGKRPDIMVSEPNVAPVVIETEVLPAVTVESDALQRLGAELQPSGRELLSSVALRMPPRLRDLSDTTLRDAISLAPDFEMALYTGESPTAF